MFFNIVCSSFKEFQCMVQKSEDPKNSKNFAKPIKIVQKFSNIEKQTNISA